MMLKELKIVILAVKAQLLDDVLKELAPHLGPEHLLVTIASGYPIDRIESFVGTDRRIVRVIPNTPV